VTPRVGPVLFIVEALRVPLAPTTSIVAGGPVATSPRPPFRWPRDLFVSAASLFSSDGDPTKAAALTLRIQDETFQDVFTDGQGGTFAVPGLALIGGPLPGAGAPQGGIKPFSLQRPVARGDQWTITITNTDTVRTITPILLFRFEEAYEPLALGYPE
jgi:hypothetical protein